MRPHRGDWQPLLPPRARIAVVMAVPTEAVLRAWDYLTPNLEPPAQQLTVVEQMMPLPAWGALCAIVAAVTLCGLFMRWPRTAIAGLRLGGATYAVLAIGQWVAVIENPWLDGVRGPAIVTIFALAYLGLARGYSAQLDQMRRRE